RDFHVTGVQTCALPICAYADAASGAAQLRVAQEIVELLDQSLALTTRRHEAGLESGLAVAQIRTLREQRAAEIPAIEAARQAARSEERRVGKGGRTWRR